MAPVLADHPRPDAGRRNGHRRLTAGLRFAAAGLLWACLSPPAFADSSDALLGSLGSQADLQVAVEQELRAGATRLGKACSKPLKDRDAKPDAPGLAAIVQRLAERKAVNGQRHEQWVISLEGYAKRQSAEHDKQCHWVGRLVDSLTSQQRRPDAPDCAAMSKEADRAKSMTEAARRLRKAASAQHELLADYVRLEQSGCLDPGFSERLVWKFLALQTDTDPRIERLMRDLVGADDVPSR